MYWMELSTSSTTTFLERVPPLYANVHSASNAIPCSVYVFLFGVTPLANIQFQTDSCV